MAEQELSIDEMHLYILNMFKALDRACKKYNITYFLSGGSAIGAIRHGGFIPWDDDADIMMPRKDFERFVRIFSKAKGRYKVASVYDNKNWTFPFARMWDDDTKIVYDNLNEASTGIFIDIYPMDGVPSSKLLTKLHYKRMKALYVLLNAAIRKRFKDDEHYIFIKKILAVFAGAIGQGRICRHINRIAKRRDFEKSEYVGCSVLSHYMEKEKFPRSDFESQRYVKFEDTYMPVPNGCENYLHALYGDFMKEPDEKGRESEHHMHAYRKR